MKIRVILAALLLLAASATSAIADAPYVGGSIGPSFYHDSDVNVTNGFSEGSAHYDTGLSLNAIGGYSFDSGFRLGGEIGYNYADLSSAGYGYSYFGRFNDTYLDVSSFMATGVYQVPTRGRVAPFFGAGIGALYGHLHDYGFNFDDTVFGYQLSTGLAIALPRNLSLDLTYKFLGAARDFHFEGLDLSYHSSNVLAGVRYTFR